MLLETITWEKLLPNPVCGTEKNNRLWNEVIGFQDENHPWIFICISLSAYHSQHIGWWGMMDKSSSQLLQQKHFLSYNVTFVTFKSTFYFSTSNHNLLSSTAVLLFLKNCIQHCFLKHIVVIFSFQVWTV